MALLMVVSLLGGRLEDLYGLTRELGMTALVEVHSEAELERAADIGAEVVGINARDLTTLEVDRSVFARLVGHVPQGAIRVAESGVSGVADVVGYRRAGADVVLMGEVLVRSGTPRTTVADFLRSAR